MSVSAAARADLPTLPDATLYSLVLDDARFVSTRHELESVIGRMADGELEAWQVIGFLESVCVDAVSQATVDAYEQVYGRSPNRPPDDESPST
jgi:hypothetical protein